MGKHRYQVLCVNKQNKNAEKQQMSLYQVMGNKQKIRSLFTGTKLI